MNENILRSLVFNTKQKGKYSLLFEFTVIFER
jgi:hypothetical protein